MFIEPMQGIEALGGLGQLGGAKDTNQTEDSNLFLNIFQDSVAYVRETEAAVTADNLALATGETDDLAAIGINRAKAELSVSLLVQLRNGFLDAYNEMMRINL